MANFFKASKKQSPKKNKSPQLSIDIDKLDMNGCGVGRFQKKPIFVEGSLAQEKVTVRLVEQKNKFARGKLLHVEQASPFRAQVKCKHFAYCGGCDLQHMDYQQQLAFKERKVSELLSRSGMSQNSVEHLPWQAPIDSKPWHYRRKARIGVQFDKNAQAVVGFRQRGTNQLVTIKSCPILVSPLDNIFPRLQKLIAKLSTQKSIGHIEVLSSQKDESDESLVTLVVRQLRSLNAQDKALWQSYATEHQWQVVFDLGNGQYESLSANKTLAYGLINDIKITFNFDDFIQVNQAVNEAMVKQAISWLALEPNDQLLDLFCGLGNFSLPIAKQIVSVVGVEGVQTMVDKAKANALNNQLDNCQFYQADLNNSWLEQTWSKNTFTKAILDPARAGAEQAIKQLGELDIPTLLYISCDPSSLARDSQLLLAQGYNISKIGIIDMFSQTKHVETMVLFNK